MQVLESKDGGLRGFLDGFFDAVRCRGVRELSLADGVLDRALWGALQAEQRTDFGLRPHATLGDSLVLRVALEWARTTGRVRLDDPTRVVLLRSAASARASLLEHPDAEWLDRVAARVVRRVEDEQEAHASAMWAWLDRAMARGAAS